MKDKKNCDDCQINKTCVYSFFFESHINKDNFIINGVNRISHPFVLNMQILSDNKAILSIVYIEKAINYIPYVSLALERAGEKGVDKFRIPFKIENSMCNGKDYVYNVKNIRSNSKYWPGEEINCPRTILFDTPCRIKKEGHFLEEIDINNFLIAMNRRMRILDLCYGDGSSTKDSYSVSYKSLTIQQRWKEQNYYSSRQKKAMKMGGVVGKIQIEEKLERFDISLLKGASIFNIGKNISFGLGKIYLTGEV